MLGLSVAQGTYTRTLQLQSRFTLSALASNVTAHPRPRPRLQFPVGLKIGYSFCVAAGCNPITFLPRLDTFTERTRIFQRMRRSPNDLKYAPASTGYLCYSRMLKRVGNTFHPRTLYPRFLVGNGNPRSNSAKLAVTDPYFVRSSLLPVHRI